MTQDYRPKCEFCGVILNKRERLHAKKKPTDKICYKCFEYFKDLCSKNGIKTDMGEQYP